jgi:hypothetical protein
MRSQSIPARRSTQWSNWQDGSAAAGIHFDMYQINCNLDMNIVRHSRYRLLIEKCHELDPAKIALVGGGPPDWTLRNISNPVPMPTAILPSALRAREFSGCSACL